MANVQDLFHSPTTGSKLQHRACELEPNQSLGDTEMGEAQSSHVLKSQLQVINAGHNWYLLYICTNIFQWEIQI